MQSEEILRPLDDITVRGGVCNWYEVANAIFEVRRRLEAALSAAEPSVDPIAWYWEDATGCFHITLDRADVVDMARKVECAPKPLYDAPPTPSVAVMAPYENDAIWARFYRDGKNLGEICAEFKCGVYDLSPWLTAPLLRSALSAQVQDVAGWQSMDTAPKDGTVIQAWHTVHNCPLAIKWVEEGTWHNGGMLNWFEKTYTTAWPEDIFSHWMPLPAAPAKQEGKP